MREIIIDSFAGGGGASEGIRAATGRDPDIAVNHDRLALAMHRMNHPGTHHLEEDVVTVDSVTMCAGRPIGMLWMSPDCKHHSKAKGGKPRDKNIRGLAWTVFGWVKRLPKWQRPRVIFLENVEEFRDWGALDEDGMPCPIQKGAIFREFVRSWQALGYVVEFRELRACDYGVPTIRKRLYMVMRRDGKPIVWGEPTHGAPTSEGVLSGRLLPYRTAAEIIDWSLPCPSIFETSAEIKRRHGIRANRPLADATMARIAKGTMRYVVNAARPFIVRTNHGDSRGRRDRGLDEPMPTATHFGGDALVQPHLVQVNHGGGAGGRDHRLDEPAPTMTAGRGEALVTPFVSYAQQGGRSRPADAPLHTVTASPKDQDQIVAPFVTKFNTGSTGHAVEEPLHTVTSHASETHGGGAAPLGVVAAHLMTMRNADKPHTAPNEPAHTITAEGAGLGLVSAFLAPRYQEKAGDEPRVRSVEEPAATIIGGDNVPGHLAAVHLSRQFGNSVGSAADEPVGTITAGGAGKAAVVAAFLAQNNYQELGHDAREPVSTIVAKGSTQSVVAAHMLNLRGSDRRDGPIDQPAPTFSAQGNHAAAVYAFLAKYYGEGLPSQPVDEPIHTITAKPRHGLVTVSGEGEPYVIVDIGMRMLTPRERFNAQGFRADYIIDTGLLEDGTTIAFTLEQQGSFCGNSVCPGMAEMLVRVNYVEQERVTPAPADDAGPLFMEAAE